MTIFPETLGGARVLMVTPIDTRHDATGATHHVSAGKLVANIAALAIGQYAGEVSCYLFYCSSDWQVLTDTMHNSIAEAQAQAEFEFRGSSTTWQSRSPD